MWGVGVLRLQVGDISAFRLQAGEVGALGRREIFRLQNRKILSSLEFLEVDLDCRLFNSDGRKYHGVGNMIISGYW